MTHHAALMQLGGARKAFANVRPRWYFLIRCAQSSDLLEEIMAWTTPMIEEICLGMEVTSYESAEIEF